MSKRFRIISVGAAVLAGIIVSALLPPSQNLTARLDRYEGEMPVMILTNSGRSDVLVSVSGDWSLARHIPIRFPPSRGALRLKRNMIFLPKDAAAQAWLEPPTLLVNLGVTGAILKHPTTLELQCAIPNRGLRDRLNRIYHWIAEHSGLPDIELFRTKRFSLSVPIPAMSFTNSVSPAR